MRSTEKYAVLSSFPISGRTSGLAAALILLLLAGAVGERSNASVTADRFGGFEDCQSVGEGAGRAAPGISRAYEALVVAQAPPSRRRDSLPWFPPTREEEGRWSPEQERDYRMVEEWLERLRGRAPLVLTRSDFEKAVEICRRRASAEQENRSSRGSYPLPSRDRYGLGSEVERGGALGEAQGGTTTRQHGPFFVPWGAWLPTGIAIRKGDSFRVRATGAYVSTNQSSDVKTCGPGGCGPWKWFGLKAKIGTQLTDVGSSGGGTAAADGVIELGSPRGGEFLREDAGNCTGTLSVEVWVTPRREIPIDLGPL